MIHENVSLKGYNTFGIESVAKRFAKFTSLDDIKTILNQRENDDLLVLGGGSNILFTRDFNGLVMMNSIKGFDVIEDNLEFVHIKVGSGENWHEFVLKCIEKDYGGVENLSLIPGTVGASPIQNIGAYGTEIKDVLVELEAYHIESGVKHIFKNYQCEFGYRDSVFKRKLKNQYIIISVTFKLTKNHVINSQYGDIKNELKNHGILNPTIRDISNAVIKIRSIKLPDPKIVGNAGSFFKNPIVDKSVAESIMKNFDIFPNYPAQNDMVKIPAGWLIDKADWKGKNFGSYGVHKNQALVIVNYSNSSGSQIYDLSSEIIDDVKNKFGITLEREVNII